jgi:hypothetical protein
MKKIASLLLCCMSLLSCAGVDLRDGSAPWDKPTVEIKDSTVRFRLPSDFVQTSEHTWHSCARKMHVAIIHDETLKSVEDFYEYSSETNVRKGEPILGHMDFDWTLYDGRWAKYYSYTGYKNNDIMAIVFLDKQVGHTIVCRSSIDSGDNFMSSCWRVMQSVKFDK